VLHFRKFIRKLKQLEEEEEEEEEEEQTPFPTTIQ